MTAHNHSHSHAANYDRAFVIGIALNVLFVLVEAFYGWQADSLALLSDAGHNLSDVLGLLMAWGGFYLARLRPNQKHTYGWGRATILAALFNALILLVAVGGIVWEAISRFRPSREGAWTSPGCSSSSVDMSFIGGGGLPIQSQTTQWAAHRCDL